MARYISLLSLLLLLSTSVAQSDGRVNNSNHQEESAEVEGGPFEYAYKYSNAANEESQSVRGVGLAKFDAAFDEHHRRQEQTKHDHQQHHDNHPSNSMYRVLTKKRHNKKRNLRKRFYLDNTLANALDSVQG